MFKPARWHRIATIPALVAALTSVARAGNPIYALVLFPWFVAIPVQLWAAMQRDDRSVRTALTITRGVAWVALAWSLLGIVLSPVGGLVLLGASIAVLAVAG